MDKLALIIIFGWLFAFITFGVVIGLREEIIEFLKELKKLKEK